MKFGVIIYVKLEATTIAKARKLAKAMYDGLWDSTPELPRPNATLIVLKDGKRVHMVKTK